MKTILTILEFLIAYALALASNFAEGTAHYVLLIWALGFLGAACQIVYFGGKRDPLD